MAFVAPFRGVRYNLQKIGRMEDVVTPPYDVIDVKGQDLLREKNPYNMIHLDLSKNFSSESLTEERYQGAKRLFANWQEEGVLVRDPQPAFYLYSIEYGHPSGRRLTRKGLVGLVRLAEFSEGIVKPHEKTFRDVTTDRLRLLDTCQAQFSQIFSVYSDPENEIMQSLERACPQEPLLQVTDGHGNKHILWQVTDADAIQRVQNFFKDKPLYIADGHHRYTTALQMRELARSRGQEVGPDSPFNHTMMYMCCMEDPGLSVLPTHRLLRFPGAISLEALAAKLVASFEAEQIKGGSREVLIGEVLARMEENGSGEVRLGLYHPGEDRCLLLTLKKEVMDKLFDGNGPAPFVPESMRELDVVVLSDLVMEYHLQLDHDRCEREKLIDYFSDPDDALDVAVKEAAAANGKTPVLFLMNATRVEQVKKVADANLVMPHKSTFFYPKILTGLLINKLVIGEKVGE